MATPSNSDISKACFHAGLTALATAAVASSLLVPLRKIDSYNALSDYVTARLELSDAVLNLEHDACWQQIRSSNDDAERWPLARLRDHRCAFPAASTPIAPKSAPPTTGANGIPPGKITNLAMLAPSMTGTAIARAFSKLNDERVLERARKSENRFDLAIYRWQLRKLHLVMSRSSIPVIAATPDRVLTPKTEAEADKVRAAMLDMDLNTLAISDARILADYEPVSLENYISATEAFRQVSIPVLSLRVPIATATIALGLLIALALLWLWMNARELWAERLFQADGDMFLLFGRNVLSRVIFRTLLLLVAMVPALLALNLPVYKMGAWALATAIVLLSMGTSRIAGKLWGRAATERTALQRIATEVETRG